MNADPEENKEWFFLGGSALGAAAGLYAGPRTLVVAAAGAVLGMILAPKPGRELRRDLGGVLRRLAVQARNLVAPSVYWDEAEPPPSAD